MTNEQIEAIKCAYLDLIGSLEAQKNMDIHSHDWKSHEQSIRDLEQQFNFIDPDLKINL